jgi:hypothetical protein
MLPCGARVDFLLYRTLIWDVALLALKLAGVGVSRLRPHRALLASSQWRIGNISTGYEIQQRPYWVGKPAQLFGRERIENITQKGAELARQYHNLLRGRVMLTVPRWRLR